ncbi:hypothetical protein WJX73_004905 [Symbiochloris irregularis]|uniref:NAD(P)-binding domain-containing protein n=1 Tax=Symbiochloris irregularis TaxID=706552 RepID=A0AAW1Q2N5_9CHLO
MHLTATTARHRSRVCGWGDELLDFIEAGPKMRKWYGEGQLILARAQVKALVRDTNAFSNAFGAYATPVQAAPDDSAALQRAMADAKAVICPGKLGAVLPAALAQKVPHIVLLTSAGQGPLKGGFFGALLRGQEQATLADPAREAAVRQSGIPCSIVGAGAVESSPGQLSSLDFKQVDGSSGSIAREDLAAVLAQASLHKPPAKGYASPLCRRHLAKHGCFSSSDAVMVRTRRQRADDIAINTAGFQDLPVDVLQVIASQCEDSKNLATVRLLCKAAAQAGSLSHNHSGSRCGKLWSSHFKAHFAWCSTIYS